LGAYLGHVMILVWTKQRRVFSRLQFSVYGVYSIFYQILLSHKVHRWRDFVKNWLNPPHVLKMTYSNAETRPVFEK